MPPLPTPNTCAVFHPDKLPFCEDFTALPNSPLLLLSCDPARHFKGVHPSHPPPGELWLFDPTAPQTPPIQILIPVTDFRPLGLSATKGEHGVRVFVTNQARTGARVEVLDLDLPRQRATHVATIRHPLIHSPNAVAAVSKDGFYLTNDAFFAHISTVGVIAEALSGLPGGSLIYVSTLDLAQPKAKRIVRLPLANGVAVDPEKQRLWVAGMGMGVYQYVYDARDPTVVEAGAFLRTAMLPDNILFSPATGGVYVSGITSLRAMGRAMGDERAVGPPSLTAQLLPKVPKTAEKAKVAWRGNDVANVALRRDEWRWGTVFVDNGTFFGGVSTGAVLEGGRFVGVSLVARGVVVCEEVPVKGGTVPEVKKESVKDEL